MVFFLLLAFSLTILISSLPAIVGGGGGSDFAIYVAAANVDPYTVYGFGYPLPAVWLIVPFAALPQPFGLILWNVIQVAALAAGTWLANRSLRALLVALALVSPALGLLLYLGQFDGLLVLGVGLGLEGIRSKRAWLVGLAVSVMTLKPFAVALPIVILIAVLPVWKMRGAALAWPLAMLSLATAMKPTWWMEWFHSWATIGQMTAIVTRFGTFEIWHPSLWLRGGIVLLSAFVAWNGIRRKSPTTLILASLVGWLFMYPMLNIYSLVLLAPVISVTSQNLRVIRPPQNTVETSSQ